MGSQGSIKATTRFGEGMSDSSCTWEQSQREHGIPLREAGGGEGKADSAAQAPRCRNEHLLLDQVVRSLTGEIFMLLREKGICLEPVC